ncbi:MAG: acyl-CoA thioesterase [Gammaproteobacteria bacterium]
MPYRHQIRVRYGECDQQGVVFNANYMAYMDDATEVWTRSLIPSGDYRDLGWEWMLVRAVVDWQGPAHNAELLDIDTAVVRWGGSSFDFGFVGRVGERPVFTARTVCVSVTPVTLEKMQTPDAVRELLGAAADWDVPA